MRVSQTGISMDPFKTLRMLYDIAYSAGIYVLLKAQQVFSKDEQGDS